MKIVSYSDIENEYAVTMYMSNKLEEIDLTVESIEVQENQVIEIDEDWLYKEEEYKYCLKVISTL
jgi:hypothetical protein